MFATYSNAAGFPPQAHLEEILRKVHELINRQTDCFHNQLVPALAENNIHFVHWVDLTEVERVHLREIFNSQIFPVLTPLAVDPSHPFPYISGLSLSLAVIVKHPETSEEFFARVKVPDVLPRFVSTSPTQRTRFIALEEIISAHLQELFPGMIIEDYYSFRLTRNEDLDIDEDEIDNILETMEQELLRRKFGPPVRLEVDVDIKSELLNRLVSELEITNRDVIKYQGPLDLTGLNIIADIDRPNLRFIPYRSQMPVGLHDSEELDADSFFQLIREREIVLHLS